MNMISNTFVTLLLAAVSGASAVALTAVARAPAAPAAMPTLGQSY